MKEDGDATRASAQAFTDLIARTRKAWEDFGTTLNVIETEANAQVKVLQSQADHLDTLVSPTSPTPSPTTYFTLNGMNGIQSDSLTFNYGDNSGQHLDSVNLLANVTFDSAGAMHLTAKKQNYPTNGRTPDPAKYTTGSVITSTPVWGINRNFRTVATVPLNFRPCMWTTDPVGDGEMDFEFFHTQLKVHVGGISDYSPLVKDQVEVGSGTTNVKRMFEMIWKNGYIVFAIDQKEIKRCPEGPYNKNTLWSCRWSHQVGGMWDGGYYAPIAGNGAYRLDPATSADFIIHSSEVVAA